MLQLYDCSDVAKMNFICLSFESTKNNYCLVFPLYLFENKVIIMKTKVRISGPEFACVITVYLDRCKNLNLLNPEKELTSKQCTMYKVKNNDSLILWNIRLNELNIIILHYNIISKQVYSGK